jgi:hypothetical protein
MKTKNIAIVLAACITAGMLVGCSDNFLNRPPKDSLVDANFYKTNDQILAGTADLYSAVWKDYCDQANWKIGDVRAGLVYSPWATSADIRDFCTFNITGLSASNVNAYKSFYQVVGQANTVIHNINTYAGSDVTSDIKNHAIAEARFMRAAAYTYLVMNYGAVPIIEDNLESLNNPNLKRNTVGSVWEFIKRDYTFASKNLSTQSLQEGRLTKWSAEGMLARTFLTMAGATGTLNQDYLDSAKYYADRVIQLSGKSLLTYYADLFKYPYDNNKESLFELEWVYSSSDALSYKYANTMVSQITPSNSIAANGDGWGGGLSATSYMLSLYDGLYVNNGASSGFTLDQRLQASFMLPGFAYPELTASDETFLSSNHVVLYNPSNVTASNPSDGNGYNLATIKKYVVGNIPGQSGKQNYPNDTYMLRLAEMYLIYAEADVLKGTVDSKTLTYFNEVYTRAYRTASNPTPSEFSDPLTLDVIFKERFKEFAMEGLAWYDLVRRSYYDLDGAAAILDSQDRGLFLAQPNPWPNPTGWSFFKTTWFTDDHVTANAGSFIMSIPQVELSQAPSLSEDPVPYEFTN